jgi:hypothetical protein
MEELLQFLQTYEIWGYAILGIIGIVYLQRLFLAWEDLRSAVYGLEKETARRRVSIAMTMMGLLMLFGLALFITVSFIAPAYPWGTRALSTPTLDFISTPTLLLETLPATLPAEAQETQAVPEPLREGCIPGQIEWISPASGEEITGTVDLTGTVNVPDFGFFKYEYTQPGSENWLTIAAGNEQKTEGILGAWNTEMITPGDYLLRLIVVNRDNQPYPACIIQVRIVPP